MNRRQFLSLAVGATALLAACQSPSVSQPSGTGQQGSPQQAPSGGSQVQKLRLGVIPTVDNLPMYVAVQEGHTEKHGVEVELVPFQSALERDAALQAESLDGELNDMISASLLNKDAKRIQIVRILLQATSARPMMVVLASPNSTIATPTDLKNVEIGISKNSVIEFATDRMLATEGLQQSEIAKIEITQIAVRAEMLAKDQIKAATLPEPLASLAVLQGARVVLDDRETQFGHSVISMRRAVIESNPEGVRRYLLAHEDAVKQINANPDAYRDLMIETGRVPEALRPTIKIPIYPTAGVPTQERIGDVMDWLVSKELLPAAISYDEMVNPSFLPSA